MGKELPRDELRENDFWALRDVAFEVKPGDTLGIIGRNGAGKSTILKTLTGILAPTRGQVRVSGRIGALIEISAGFHQDLTGRENVQLQGAIMGMPKKLIARKFDEIVEFAGVARFIDTPVKRYSSGMNARLGFAIAAHLDPDVIVIDEVLSVGDYAFQTKAFDRVSQLARSGLPVVVVSHQLDRITQLCDKAILLEAGHVARAGTTADCITAYLSSKDKPTREEAAVSITAIDVDPDAEIVSGTPVLVRVSGSVDGSRVAGSEIVGFEVRNLETGTVLAGVSNERLITGLPSHGAFTLTWRIQLNIPPGLYGIDSAVWDREWRRVIAHGPGVHVQVVDGPFFWGAVQLNAEIQLEHGTTSSPRGGPERDALPGASPDRTDGSVPVQ